MSYSSSLVCLPVSEELTIARKDALSRGIPVADDETLQYLLYTVCAVKPKRILEIGTAVGLSAIAMAEFCPQSKLTSVECDEERYNEALKNFEKFGVKDRITVHLADAMEFLQMTDGEYDFIFLDGPKAQYTKYLPDLKRILKRGGVLFADDVLLYGWVDGKEETPQKRHVIVDKLREYLQVVSSDADFITSVLDVGDGVAVSVLINDEYKRNGK